MESSKPKVVITGISGYLGSHICKQFLENQEFQVRGTVRSKNNPKKIDPLKKAFGDNFSKLEIVEADLLDKNSIFNAIEGCQFVVHNASPYPDAPPKDESLVIRPAVEGTLAVLQAAHKFKVKRVVLTSSVAAISNRITKNQKKIYNESDWSDEAACMAYEKSKFLAEKKAWDFVKSLPEKERFELVVLNPSFTMGPNLIESSFTSSSVLQKLMSESVPGLGKLMLAVVDVRDVAIAHVQAIKKKEAANQRIIIFNRSVWSKELAEIVKYEFGKYYKIPTNEVNYMVFKMVAVVDNQIKLIAHLWGVEYAYENDKSKKILEIQYRPLKETLIEMAHSLIQSGMIQNKLPKGKL